jgi:hypothetical protein
MKRLVLDLYGVALGRGADKCHASFATNTAGHFEGRHARMLLGGALTAVALYGVA